ncbi:hypothetical protein Poly30_13680 [Planctomycetes bacterium Poly30]|uniref:Right handed beta helix domain-containing protein n=1 Tax=Saltatorellus ferox TaxID=2528018 RepID=A0A518EP54_9BACT|nr:hypothetical protein Poly30_13680 [Planctomycetes bacterium Poly30]
MTSRFAAAAAVAALFASTSFAQTIYVDANLATGANDGSSWADAFQGPSGLQGALAVSAAGDDIFVADGTYVPAAVGSRGTSFRLQNDVRILGGFAGGESSPDARPAFGVAESILSGDLAGDDTSSPVSRAENSYHVVRTTGTNATAVLDGFTIRSGNSNSGSNGSDRGGGILCISGVSPTIRNCSFVDNRCIFGGGAGYVNGSGPRFENCSFVDNQGGAFGGAFDIANGGAIVFDGCYFEGNEAARAGALEIFSTSSALVVNSVFIGNTALGSSGGGAFWVGSGGTTRIINCTIVGNRSLSQNQGGIREQGANVLATNCILWDNEGPGGAQTAANQANPAASINYSIVEGGFGSGVGNLATDPNFVTLAGGDLRLALPSPAVDAGDGGVLAAEFAGDFDGSRRVFDEPGTANTGAGAPIDMGAFEFSTNVGAVFCSPVALNSTGLIGRIDAVGSASVAANDVTLVTSQLPTNAFGFFLVSRDRGFTANPGGSAGNLCLSGALGRYVGPGQVQNTGTTDGFSLMIDLATIPQPTGSVPAMVGESWSFQAWHRDAVLGIPTSNFTDGVRVTFGS